MADLSEFYMDDPKEEKVNLDEFIYSDPSLTSGGGEYSDPTSTLPQMTMQDAINVGQRGGHYMTMGLGQHAAGLGAGLGAGVQQFMDSDQPLADRAANAFERFKSSYGQGRQDYNQEQQELSDKLTPGGEFGAAVLGGLTTLKLPIMGMRKAATEAKTASEAAKRIADTALKAGLAQGALGFLGSEADEIENMAWDGLFSAGIGTGLPVVGSAAAKTVEKLEDFRQGFMGGYDRMREAMTGIPDTALEEFVKRGPKGIEKFIRDTGAKPDDLKLAANKFMGAIREKIDARKKGLNSAYASAVQAQFGNTPLPEKLMKDTFKKIDEQIAKLNPRVDGHSAAISELRNLKHIMSGTKETVEGANTGIMGLLTSGSSKLPDITSFTPPTYHEFFQMYKQAKEKTQVNFSKIGDPTAKSNATATSNAIAALISDEGGDLKNTIRKISPDIGRIDEELSKIYKLNSQFNTNILKEKGSKFKYIKPIAKGEGDPGEAARKLDEFDPNLKVSEGASIIYAADKLRYSNLTPESFAMRNLSQLMLNAGVVGGGALLSGADPGLAAILAGTVAGGSYFTTTPASRRLGGDIQRGVNFFTKTPPMKKYIGPTIEAARGLAGDIYNTEAFQKAVVDEIKSRVEPEEIQLRNMDPRLMQRLGQ